jgi:hypothetical protein
MQQSDGLEKSALDDELCQLYGVWLIKIGKTPQTGAFEMGWQNTAIKLFDPIRNAIKNRLYRPIEWQG